MGIFWVNKLYQYRVFSLIRVFFYLAIPLYIVLQPVNFMDHTSLCLIQMIFEKECLFCGMTRAFIHILHFDFVGAYTFNPLSYIVFPSVCLWVFYDCYGMVKHLKKVD